MTQLNCQENVYMCTHCTPQHCMLVYLYSILIRVNIGTSTVQQIENVTL